MTAPQDASVRDLRSLDDCRAVVGLQEAVWGADGETVPSTVLFVSAKRGGVLLGAWNADELAGFVWSLPGLRDDGERTHWSHMLGVRPGHRQQRLAERLKLAQRDRVLAQGVDLIEWTFDPLQAANAHFNLHVLGAVGVTFGINIYGALAGVLHRGTPTDRLIVEWRLRTAHVERRLAARRAAPPAGLTPIGADALEAPAAIRTIEESGWMLPILERPRPDGRRFLVPVPPRFLEMQQQAPERALAWRLAFREVMVPAIESGYQVVDFFLNREQGGGRYLLAAREAD